MKKFIKKLSIFVAVILIFNLGVIECFAYEKSNDVPVTLTESAQPREIFMLSKPYTLQYGTYYCHCTVYYTVRGDDTNASGFYITGVNRIDEGSSNWYRMGDISVTSISYDQNCQIAYVNVEYTASIGAGFEPYTDQIVISCYDI